MKGISVISRPIAGFARGAARRLQNLVESVGDWLEYVFDHERVIATRLFQRLLFHRIIMMVASAQTELDLVYTVATQPEGEDEDTELEACSRSIDEASGLIARNFRFDGSTSTDDVLLGIAEKIAPIPERIQKRGDAIFRNDTESSCGPAFHSAAVFYMLGERLRELRKGLSGSEADDIDRYLASPCEVDLSERVRTGTCLLRRTLLKDSLARLFGDSICFILANLIRYSGMLEVRAVLSKSFRTTHDLGVQVALDSFDEAGRYIMSRSGPMPSMGLPARSLR